MVGPVNNSTGGPPARRSRGKWIWTTVAVVIVVAIAVVLVTVRPWTAEFRHGGLRIAAAPTPAQVSPRVVPAFEQGNPPSTPGLQKALAQVAASPDLGSFSGSVSDPATGKAVWSASSDKPVIPASTLKVLTAGAAMLALPPDHRLTTRVVAGSTPGEVVLVGAGDPTLTAQPDGKGYYTNAPKLSDLISQIRAGGHPVDSVVVDNSAYAGPTWPAGWDPADIAGGSWAPIESVMLDGGRLDPLADYSRRSGTPALDAGRRLAQGLGVDPAKVHLGKAAPGAADLAHVDSALLRDRLRDMMNHSDDVLAEAIGREIAGAAGGERSFAGAAAATATTLHAAGFDITGMSLVDNSGLSVNDRVPARLLDRILAVAAGSATTPAEGTAGSTSGVPQPSTGADPTGAAGGTSPPGASLAPLLDYLPIAGGSGTLADRFADRGPQRAGAGWVRAKTGTLSVSSALAGYVLDRDGRVMTFALMSNDRPPEASRPALDTVATALRNCGCS